MRKEHISTINLLNTAFTVSICAVVLSPCSAQALLNNDTIVSDHAPYVYTESTDTATLEQPSNSEQLAYMEAQNTPAPATEHMKEARAKYEANRIDNIVFMIAWIVLAFAASTVSAVLIFKHRQKEFAAATPMPPEITAGNA